MKLSLNWLSDFVEWNESDPEIIAERLTACTAEVEWIERQGEFLEHCCVGKVLGIEKHPNADKLLLVDVETDQGKKRVVCGGTNLREGMHSAFAHVGATVKWHGEEILTISSARIRGEVSEGMICAAEELELTTLFPECTGHDIVDLGEGGEVGQSLREYLQLTDTIFHVDNHAITHRPDLFSHMGFARECVSSGLGKWKDSKIDTATFPTAPKPIECKVDIKQLVPRYLACTLSIEGVGETPEWMKRRLEAVGYRSLNLPIDITNYVSAELGMPLHSFDRDELKGIVHFRKAKSGECIVTLDTVERELPKGAIVLSDDEGIFDLMGIMGGLRSSTKEGTKNIYLHSAVIDPIAIRKTVLKTGHRTDAATIYEKGIPNITAEQGFFRALELFLKLVPGATITSKLDSWGDNGKAKPIKLSHKHALSLLGTDISKEETTQLLENMGFEVSSKNSTILSVTPPLHRLKDIHGEHDLIEEIGRIVGYDRIEPTMPFASIVPPKQDRRLNVIRDTLKGQGYTELTPLSLVGAALVQKAGFEPGTCIEIENPLSEDVALLQPTVLPRLLEHAEENMLHVEKNLRSFTIAHVFGTENERVELGLLFAKKLEQDLKHHPFFELKAELLEALKKAGHTVEVEFLTSPPSFAHPGQSASLLSHGTSLGILAGLHPGIQDAFDLPSTATSLLNLTTLLSLESEKTIASPLPRFPAISYDFTIPWNHNRPVGELVQKLKARSSLLEEIHVQDLYEEKGGKDGLYNLTLRCTYRAPDRTLKEEEIQTEHKKILSAITQ